MNKIIIVVVVLLMGGLGYFFLNKPSQSKPEQTIVETSTGADVVIKDFKFNPGTLTVKPGEVVSIVNKDVAGHSFTADDGSVDTGVLSQNADGSITAPSKPGTYKFHCIPHPSITGVLVVE